MSAESPDRIRLLDSADETGRTTASLVGSLASRLLTLHYTSGMSVVGSLVAGLAGLGREVSSTADGARMRQALEEGLASENGDALWRTLRIGEWASGLPPSPVLDHVRNDLALLLADDLIPTLEQPLAPPERRADSRMAPLEEVTCIDCILGLWAYSMEIVRAVEAVAEPKLPEPGTVVRRDATGGEPEGSLLR